jgi:hypothetical protein
MPRNVTLSALYCIGVIANTAGNFFRAHVVRTR